MSENVRKSPKIIRKRPKIIRKRPKIGGGGFAAAAAAAAARAWSFSKPCRGLFQNLDVVCALVLNQWTDTNGPPPDGQEGGRRNRWTDVRMGRRTGGRTDGRTDGQNCNDIVLSHDHKKLIHQNFIFFELAKRTGLSFQWFPVGNC